MKTRRGHTATEAYWLTSLNNYHGAARRFLVADLQALRQLCGPITPRLLLTSSALPSTAMEGPSASPQPTPTG